jgi:hypothetical protein
MVAVVSAPTGIALAVESYGAKRRAGLAWRLPPAHAAPLRDVAQGVEESKVGVACRYLLEGEPGHEEIDHDGYVHRLEEIERFCDRENVWAHPTLATWRHGISRCRRALARLRIAGEHRHAAVLMVVYGYRTPTDHELTVYFDEETAPLARYTDAVERRRLEGAHASASEWSTGPRGPVVDLGRRRALIQWCDRAISSGDALRMGLAAFSEPACMPVPGESIAACEARREGRKRRKAAHEERRLAFVSDVRMDAHRMLVAAERAYWEAWLAVPT